MDANRRETIGGIEDDGMIDGMSADEMSHRRDAGSIGQMNVDGTRYRRDGGITGQMIVGGAVMSVTGRE